MRWWWGHLFNGGVGNMDFHKASGSYYCILKDLKSTSSPVRTVQIGQQVYLIGSVGGLVSIRGLLCVSVWRTSLPCKAYKYSYKKLTESECVSSNWSAKWAIGILHLLYILEVIVYSPKWQRLIWTLGYTNKLVSKTVLAVLHFGFVLINTYKYINIHQMKKY